MSRRSSHVTKDCVNSIRSLLSDPDFGRSCSSDLSLCKTFNDGEILCSIATQLSRGRVSSEGALTTSFYSANSQMLAKRNVRYFLEQCREVFHLEDRELFEPEDLLKLRNPERVVKTVHRLLSIGSDGKEAEESGWGSEGDQSSGVLANVVTEICNHEKALADKLMKLLMYRKELLGFLSEWSQDLVSEVFRHTEQLYTLHTEFHARLTALASHGCQQFCQQLGEVFSQMVPKLEIYLQYFSHLRSATALMDEELKKSPELKNQLDKLDTFIGQPCFRSLYDAPIRQTTNYQQLFQRLYKTAVKEAPETQQSVDRALTELKALLVRANTFKREAEQTEATKQVLATIKDLPCQYSQPADVGLHLGDGSFKVRRRTSDHKESRMFGYCVLTTKQLLVAAKASRKEPRNFWFAIPITSSLQARVCDGSSLEIVHENGDTVKLEESKVAHVYDVWMQHLSEAKRLNFPEGWNSNRHAFHLATLPAGTECSCCRRAMNGSVLQGYSCWNCNCHVDFNCLKELTRRVCSAQAASGIRGRAAMAYYHRDTGRDRAASLLYGKEAGAFLIRDEGGGAAQSGEEHKVLSIKFLDDIIIHMKIAEDGDRCALHSCKHPLNWFDSLDQLINHFKRFDMFEQSLTKLTNGVRPM